MLTRSSKRKKEDLANRVVLASLLPSSLAQIIGHYGQEFRGECICHEHIRNYPTSPTGRISRLRLLTARTSEHTVWSDLLQSYTIEDIILLSGVSGVSGEGEEDSVSHTRTLLDVWHNHALLMDENPGASRTRTLHMINQSGQEVLRVHAVLHLDRVGDSYALYLRTADGSVSTDLLLCHHDTPFLLGTTHPNVNSYTVQKCPRSATWLIMERKFFDSRYWLRLVHDMSIEVALPPSIASIHFSQEVHVCCDWIYYTTRADSERGGCEWVAFNWRTNATHVFWRKHYHAPSAFFAVLDSHLLLESLDLDDESQELTWRGHLFDRNTFELIKQWKSAYPSHENAYQSFGHTLVRVSSSKKTAQAQHYYGKPKTWKLARWDTASETFNDFAQGKGIVLLHMEPGGKLFVWEHTKAELRVFV